MAHKPLRIVTTSWDDGDPRDLRIAELLIDTGLRGTFYVPLRGYLGMPVLEDHALRTLSEAGFEIGAHTVSHRTLVGLTEREIDEEIRGGKETLQAKLGMPVRMFCYPNGRYNQVVSRRVHELGYEGARTTRMLSLETRFPRMQMPTTLQAYPHALSAYLRNVVRGRRFGGSLQHISAAKRGPSWVELGKRLFDKVLDFGGVWHLYGHSWEIDQFGLWEGLSELLKYVSHREGITYATNEQTLATCGLPTAMKCPAQAGSQYHYDHRGN